MANPLGAAVPVIYSGRLLRHLDDAKVFAGLMTREYEGEIRQRGDSVRILTPSTITVGDYTKYSTTVTAQTVNVDPIVMLIDQAKYFSFKMEDIDRVQQNPKLFDEFMRRAAIDLAEAVDTNLATVLANGVATANQVGTVTVGTGAGDADLYETIVDMRNLLDENNVPRSGRWLVLPPDGVALLLKDPRFVSFGTSANRMMLTRGDGSGDIAHPDNGKISFPVAGFDVYMSNNLTSGSSGTLAVAGHRSAAAYAEQLRRTDQFRRQSDFADEFRGLLVFGRKVLDANRLVSCDLVFA